MYVKQLLALVYALKFSKINYASCIGAKKVYVVIPLLNRWLHKYHHTYQPSSFLLDFKQIWYPSLTRDFCLGLHAYVVSVCLIMVS